MSKLSIEELAQQVADAFATAFPESTRAQSQSQSQPQAELQVPADSEETTAKSSCYHTIPGSLVLRLPDPHLCPRCIITSHIEAVEDVQKQLASRGGAFTSKEIADGRQHRTVKRAWGKAKVGLANTVARFEALLADPQTSAEARVVLTDALEVWDKGKDALTRVPGVVYVGVAVEETPTRVYVEGGENEEPTEEDHEVARLMIELLKMELEKEMTAEDKEFLKPDESNFLHRNLRRDRSAPQELLQKPLNPVTSPKTQNLEVPSDSEALPTQTTRKSILKRGPSLSPSSSPQRKRSRLIEVVTVSPEYLNTSNPSPFVKLPTAATVQPHSIHTSAEHKRRKGAFWRYGSIYIPGIWASQSFEEKANTSFSKKAWDQMERRVKRDQKEAEEERSMAERLKAIVGAWLGLWWLQKIKDIDWREFGDTVGSN